jgi:glycosyltransferase involved in cell wall biosynthesis
MAQAKILALASAIDLDFRYGCTPAWWQLWKGLYEVGADVIVTPYRGRAITSPWWLAYDNPCFYEAELFAAARRGAAWVRRDDLLRRREQNPTTTRTDRVTGELIRQWIRPRWRRHVASIVERERPDAVVVFGIPISHLRGIPAKLREKYSIPVAYYDGDVPMSLPEFGGMDTGFNIYPGADPGEYDLLISNSAGGGSRLRELGARRVETLFWGADPDFFMPLKREKTSDVFFYGYGDKFRREWIDRLISEPSQRLHDIRFAVGGGDFRGQLGAAERVGWIPFSRFPAAISASRINLNITRRPHATVGGSSTARLFELAACGSAIVSNPQEDIERWFEPNSELVVVGSAEAAASAYEELLGDPAYLRTIGERARARVLDEHTYAHRARRLLAILGLDSSGAGAGSATGAMRVSDQCA